MHQFGFSGDYIQVKDKYVYKVCKTDQNRFLRNIDKQKNFHNKYIKAVPILEQGVVESGENYVKMPLMQCENSLFWISKSCGAKLDNLIDKLSNYFNSIIETSVKQSFDDECWRNKILDLKSKIQDDYLQGILNKLLELDTSKDFYYGDSHGDFTLSNFFIYQDGDSVSIEAIDFLDTFIFSPIHDFVKIRQDTYHLWTFNIGSDIEGIDKNKIAMALNYIDEQIKNIIAKDEILDHYYVYFQTLNLLRIVPYNKDPLIFEYIKKEIQELEKCLPH